MTDGWIPLWRSARNNPIFRRDRTAWHVFEVLLLYADHKTGVWSGGRNQLGALADEQPITTYKALKRLEKAKMVTLDSNTKFTTIYICNWDKYQLSDNTSGEQRGNNAVTTRYQRGNTLTIKKKEERKKEMDSVPESPERSVGYLLDMPLADQAAFGQKFDLSLQAVKDKAEAIHDWHLGNPKRNKRDNWKSVLRNALREDADKLRAKHGPYTPPGYTPTAQDWDFLRMGMVEVFIGEAKVWAEEQIRNGTVIV